MIRSVVFTVAIAGTVVAQPTQLCITPGATLNTACDSIALAADGTTAVFGEGRDSAGAARVFIRSSGIWVQQASLSPVDGSGPEPHLGTAAAISSDGNTALVGAGGDSGNVGAAHVFVRSGSVWLQQGPKLTPSGGGGPMQYFGGSCSLSADGNTALIGAVYDNGQIGAAYVFVRSGGVWAQQGPRFTPPPGAGGYFGNSVSLSADGNTAAIGVPLPRKVYIYVRSGGTWTQQGSALTPIGAVNPTNVDFGNSVSLSASGSTLVVGSQYDNPDVNGNGIGAAYVFQRVGTTWTQQGTKLVPSLNTLRYFGYSVALSGDGNSFIAGMPGGNPSAAFVFTRSGSVWTEQGSPLLQTGNFGNAAAINSDGTTAMIGAHNALTVYVYGLSREISYVGQPAPLTICPTNAANFSVTVTGTSPTFRWQREISPGTGTFVNLTNGSTASWDGESGAATVFGATTNTFIIAPDVANGRVLSQAHAIQYRCLVTNTCGSVASSAALLIVCPADFNCDGEVNFFDYLDFVDAFSSQLPISDFNHDGGIDFFDYLDFVDAFSIGC